MVVLAGRVMGGCNAELLELSGSHGVVRDGERERLVAVDESDEDSLAAVLIVASAAAASLQAIDAKFLASRRMDWKAISLAMNGTSALLLLSVAVRRRRPLHLEDARWLALRALLGGVSLNAAVAAVTHIDIASANTIMFSMPCFATAFTCLIDRETPNRSDALRLGFGFSGTLAVVWAGHHAHLSSSSSRSRVLGYGGALGFAICNALACIVTSRKLRRFDAALVCAAQAVVASAMLLPFLGPHALLLSTTQRLKQDAQLSALFLLEILSFPLSLYLRTAALVRTRNVHVVSLLYSEIPLVLVWDTLFCHAPLNALQVAGVLVIVAGVVLANRLSDLGPRGGGGGGEGKKKNKAAAAAGPATTTTLVVGRRRLRDILIRGGRAHHQQQRQHLLVVVDKEQQQDDDDDDDDDTRLATSLLRRAADHHADGGGPPPRLEGDKPADHSALLYSNGRRHWAAAA